MQNKRLLNIFILQLLLFLSVGCGESPHPAPVVKKVPPSWVYGVTPQDTAFKMYGLGIGKSRDDAIKIALNDMVSKLSVSLQSSFKSREKVSGFYHASTVTSDIEATVSKIKINNYRVIRSYRIKYNEFAVLVETDKKRFVQGLEEDLEREYEGLLLQYRHLHDYNTIEHYNKQKELLKSIASLETSMVMIHELDPNFSEVRYEKFIQEVRGSYQKIRNTLKFYVVGDRDSKPFVEKLKNNLADKKFAVTFSKEDAIVVKVRTRRRESQDLVKIIVYTISISLYDHGMRIGGNVITIKERYSDKNRVLEMARIHFNELIKRKGLGSVLGITLNTAK